MYILTFRGISYFKGAYSTFEEAFNAIGFYLPNVPDDIIGHEIIIYKIKEEHSICLRKDEVFNMKLSCLKKNKIRACPKGRRSKESHGHVGRALPSNQKIYLVYNENMDWIYFTTPFKAIEYIQEINYCHDFSIYEYNIGSLSIHEECIKEMNDSMIWSSYNKEFMDEDIEDIEEPLSWSDIQSCWIPKYRKYCAIQIQKVYRGLLGRRYATHMKYKPDGPGFLKAKKKSGPWP